MKKVIALTMVLALFYSCKDESHTPVPDNGGGVMPRVGGALFNVSWDASYPAGANNKCYGVELKVATSSSDLTNGKFVKEFSLTADSRTGKMEGMKAGMYYYKATTKLICEEGPETPVIKTKLDSFDLKGGYVQDVAITIE